MTTSTQAPCNTDDVVDSRDVIARIDELTEDPDLADYSTELVDLTALAAEAADYADDWEYGETLIRDSYFQTYAQELAEDVCTSEFSRDWPFRCIDWEQAARELQQDYTVVEFAGVTYWIR